MDEGPSQHWTDRQLPPNAEQEAGMYEHAEV